MTLVTECIHCDNDTIVEIAPAQFDLHTIPETLGHQLYVHIDTVCAHCGLKMEETKFIWED